MKIRKETKNELYLYNTGVENFFIAEYLPFAPGDAVKVYLYAQMYEGLSREITNERIAKALRLSRETVEDAWTYWDKKGVVRKIFRDPSNPDDYDIAFLRLKEKVYGRKTALSREDCADAQDAAPYGAANREPSEPNPLMDENVRNMFHAIEAVTGEPVSDALAIYGWLEKYGASPETVSEAFRYAAVSRKNTRTSYVEAIVREWAEKGLLSKDAIEEYLSAHDARHASYRRILRALGFYRNATEEEERLMNSWFDDFGATLEDVLDACKKTVGISNPNLKYIDRVLRSRYRDEHGRDPAVTGEKPPVADPSAVTAAFVKKRMDEYARLREKEEREAEERRNAIYKQLPRVAEIDFALRKTAIEVSRMALGGANAATVSEARKRMGALTEEKEMLLARQGLSTRALEIQYTCEKCRDTGYLEDGTRCMCFVNGTPNA